MFSGIVVYAGRVTGVIGGKHKKTLHVALGPLAKRARVGQSISVSGVCLTLTAVAKGIGAFDVVTETLARTTLGKLKPGQKLNLEPALRLNAVVGGHLVTGHVDGVAKIKCVKDEPGQRTMQVEIPRGLAAEIAEKGSVALDGVSLTVADLTRNAFSVALIPHTLKVTTLGERKAGDDLNLETDLIAKHVARFLAIGYQPRPVGKKRTGITAS